MSNAPVQGRASQRTVRRNRLLDRTPSNGQLTLAHPFND